LLQEFRRDVEVGGNVVHVFAFFKRRHEFQHPLGFRALEFHGIGGDASHFRGFHFNALGFEGLAHVLHPVRLGADKESSFLVDHVIGSGFKRAFEDLILIAFRDRDLPEQAELPANAARFTEVAAIFGEQMADGGSGAVAVIRSDFDHYGHSARAVAFINDFFVGFALDLPRALLDGAQHGVLGHVDVFRRLNGRAKARVAGGIAAADPRGDG